MAEIVLVHGIAQEQQSADTLENRWLPALAGGVRSAGYSVVADRIWLNRGAPQGIDARMAFYGAIFLRPDQQGPPSDWMAANSQGLEEQLSLLWLERATRRASHAFERSLASAELAYVQHRIGYQEGGAGELKRKAVASLCKLRWFAPFGIGFASRFVWTSLSQVLAYFENEEIRESAQQAVLRLIRPETKIIVSHSLGSVVAYEALFRVNSPIELFVTLGSPLGLENVIYQRLRPTPPTYPRNVLRWVNLAAKDDIVAAEPELARMFARDKPQNAIFETSWTVDNGAEPHNSEFYLTKKSVGQAIGETLTRGLQVRNWGQS